MTKHNLRDLGGGGVSWVFRIWEMGVEEKPFEP